MKNNNSIIFTKVITEDVLNFINSAKERILYAKPAFLKKEVELIWNVVEKKGITCDLYFEAGDNAIRLGFGEPSALDFINEHLDSFNVHIADKIRIAILIIDDRTLIYMPSIGFIEEETKELTFPNGFLGNNDVTDEIVSQFLNKSKNASVIDKTGNVVMFPGGYIPEFDTEEVKNDMKRSIKSLNENPPIDPSRLKRVNFYRDKYKIVKMQVFGIKIENKKISLKPFYVLLDGMNEKLKSSWNILSADDIEKLQDTKCFYRELNKITQDYKNYLFDAGRFGSIISITKKKEFSDKIETLKKDFISYLKNEASPKVKLRFLSDDGNIDNKKDLKTLLEESRKELVNHLLKICPDDEGFLKKIFSEYRHLKNEYENGIKKEEIYKQFVELFVINKLKFTEMEEIIDKIDIKLDYYDISDELIFNNEDFNKIILKYKLELRQNSVGYEGN